MRSTRSLRSVAAIGALAFVSVAGTLPAAAKSPRPVPPGQSVTIDIASITDFHGQVKTVETTVEDQIVITNGGVSGVSGVVETLRAANPNTIFVANGDSVGGSAFESAVLEDRPTLELLNAMGLFVSNTGNHEFDKGWLDLRDRILPLADFDFLGANLNGTPELAPWQVWKAPGNAGVSVAFVGTLTEDLPTLVSPAGIEGITLDPICDTLNSYAAQLSDGRSNNGEADIVIALSHEGHETVDDCAFDADVDAVLTGHTHDPFVGTVTRSDGVAIPLIEGANAGRTVAHLSLTYQRNTRTLTYGVAENIVTAEYVDMATPEVEEIVQRTIDESAEAGKAVVGAITDDLLLPNDNNGNRGAETTIGTFLGDVALWHGSQIANVDFGVINPGGIRASFLYAGDTATNPLNVDGAVTYAEAFTVQPFGNTMAYIDLTGEQVDLLLEQQFYPRGSRPMLRLGLSANVQYVFDAAAAAGSRVSDIFIDGDRVDPAANETYTVAGNAFLLAGGDAFTVFQQGTNYVDTGIIDLQVLIDYFLSHDPVAPVYSQGSTGLTLSGALVPGSVLTASIYSLAFTNGETTPGSVTLFIDGAAVGSGNVTIVPVYNNDVTGQASIAFTVPAGASADSVLRIVTDDGTTDITF